MNVRWYVYINVWNRHLIPIPTPIPITTIPIPITTIPIPPKRTINDSDSGVGVGIVVWFRSRNRPRSDSRCSPWMAIWRITGVNLTNHQDSASNSLHHPSNQLWMRTKRQDRLTGVALINIYYTIISTDDIIKNIQICKETPRRLQFISLLTEPADTPMLVWVLTFVDVVSNGRRKSKMYLSRWVTCMMTDNAQYVSLCIIICSTLLPRGWLF